MNTPNDTTGNGTRRTFRLKEWQAARHILTRAAELIQERGWQQGALQEVTTHCLATAMEEAFRENNYTIVDFNYAREAISQIIKIPREPTSTNTEEIAYWGKNLMEWNDDPERKEMQVLEALRSAAIFSDEKHKLLRK